jgi:FAD:protein FMN transferase
MPIWRIIHPALCCLLFLTNQVKSQTAPLYRYEFQHRQMGTLFRIVLFAPDSTLGRQAAAAAFRRVDTLNTVMSDYLPDSELNRLSATAGTGQVIAVSTDLFRALSISQRASRQSGAAFDITLGPYTQLWRRSVRQQALPSQVALAKARKAVGYQYVLLNEAKRTAKLVKPGMRLDLGGIGKGFAADEALAELKKLGIRSALVDAGGNVVVSEAPPNEKGWQVELKLPGAEQPGWLLLTNAAVSTSGDLYQYLELANEKGITRRYSHIIDPQTGLGLMNQSQATVIAPNGTLADWLSTTVCVLGPTKGIRLAEEISGVAAFVWSQRKGKIQSWQSKRWQKIAAFNHIKK